MFHSDSTLSEYFKLPFSTANIPIKIRSMQMNKHIQCDPNKLKHVAFFFLLIIRKFDNAALFTNGPSSRVLEQERPLWKPSEAPFQTCRCCRHLPANGAIQAKRAQRKREQHVFRSNGGEAAQGNRREKNGGSWV